MSDPTMYCVNNIVEQSSTSRRPSSAVYFFSVLHAVDGYGFGMVVDIIENSIVPDSQPVSFDALELPGLVLPGLFGEGLDFIIQDCKVLRPNGAQVFLNGRLGEDSIHQRRLDFFRRDSISRYGTAFSRTTERKAFLSSRSSRARRSFSYSLISRITAFFLPFSSVIY